MKKVDEEMEKMRKERDDILQFFTESNFEIWWKWIAPRDLYAAEIIIKFHDQFCTRVLREVLTSYAPTDGAAQFYRALKDLFSTSKLTELRFEKLLGVYHSADWDTVWSCHPVLGPALLKVITSIEESWTVLHPDFAMEGWRVTDLMKNFSNILEIRNRVNVVTIRHVGDVDALKDVRAACDKGTGSLAGFNNPCLIDIGPLLKKLCDDELMRVGVALEDVSRETS